MTDRCHVCNKNTGEPSAFRATNCRCSYKISYMLAIIKAVAEDAPSLETARELCVVAVKHLEANK